MEQYRVKESSDVSLVEGPGRSDPAAAPSGRTEPLPETVEPASEHEPLPESVEPAGERATLRAEVQRLEAELERYRTHAERTSKLFLSATNYAQWVRESARQDAELALRKARVRAERLAATAEELAQTEHELARVQEELTHLQALSEETRARLSSFLAAGLEALTTEGGTVEAVAYEPTPGEGDLPDTLHRQAASTSEPVHARLADAENSGD